MTENKRDFLAVITTAYGGGSYARGPDKEDCISRVVRIYKSDWKSMFKMEKGREVIVNVIEVTGYDTVYWDDRGFWSEKKKIDRPIEQVKRKLP